MGWVKRQAGRLGVGDGEMVGEIDREMVKEGGEVDGVVGRFKQLCDRVRIGTKEMVIVLLI